MGDGSTVTAGQRHAPAGGRSGGEPVGQIATRVGIERPKPGYLAWFV
jgi:hypothetical protein